MSDQPTGINESLWEFPCAYDLKVMGEAQHPMESIVTEIVAKHIEDFDPANIRSKTSRTGKYISVTASFTFRSKSQVENLYAELDARPEVVGKL